MTYFRINDQLWPESPGKKNCDQHKPLMTVLIFSPKELTYTAVWSLPEETSKHIMGVETLHLLQNGIAKLGLKQVFMSAKILTMNTHSATLHGHFGLLTVQPEQKQQIQQLGKT